MTESEPAAPPPEHERRFLIWGVLGDAVAIPLVVFGVMQIINALVFECRHGGAEDSLSCVLRTLAIGDVDSGRRGGRFLRGDVGGEAKTA